MFKTRFHRGRRKTKDFTNSKANAGPVSVSTFTFDSFDTTSHGNISSNTSNEKTETISFKQRKGVSADGIHQFLKFFSQANESPNSSLKQVRNELTSREQNAIKIQAFIRGYQLRRLCKKEEHELLGELAPSIAYSADEFRFRNALKLILGVWLPGFRARHAAKKLQKMFRRTRWDYIKNFAELDKYKISKAYIIPTNVCGNSFIYAKRKLKRIDRQKLHEMLVASIIQAMKVEGLLKSNDVIEQRETAEEMIHVTSIKCHRALEYKFQHRKDVSIIAEKFHSISKTELKLERIYLKKHNIDDAFSELRLKMNDERKNFHALKKYDSESKRVLESAVRLNKCREKAAKLKELSESINANAQTIKDSIPSINQLPLLPNIPIDHIIKPRICACLYEGRTKSSQIKNINLGIKSINELDNRLVVKIKCTNTKLLARIITLVNKLPLFRIDQRCIHEANEKYLIVYKPELKRNIAAVLIQKTFRSYYSLSNLPTKFQHMLIRKRSAICLQRWWRTMGYRSRMIFIKKLNEYANYLISSPSLLTANNPKEQIHEACLYCETSLYDLSVNIGNITSGDVEKVAKLFPNTVYSSQQNLNNYGLVFDLANRFQLLVGTSIRTNTVKHTTNPKLFIKPPLYSNNHPKIKNIYKRYDLSQLQKQEYVQDVLKKQSIVLRSGIPDFILYKLDLGLLPDRRLATYNRGKYFFSMIN